MFNELHVDLAGEEREFNRAQFSERPAFPAASHRDRFIPDGRHFFTQRLLLDLHQAGKKLRDFFNAVRFLLGRCWHSGGIESNTAPFFSIMR